LNGSCYNGLYRVNRDNQFDVPFGRYKDPVICDIPNLLAARQALQDARLFSKDYVSFLAREAQVGDFTYLDPPYWTLAKRGGSKPAQRLDGHRAIRQLVCFA
jgi:DNA adenine methylase